MAARLCACATSADSSSSVAAAADEANEPSLLSIFLSEYGGSTVSMSIKTCASLIDTPDNRSFLASASSMSLSLSGSSIHGSSICM